MLKGQDRLRESTRWGTGVVYAEHANEAGLRALATTVGLTETLKAGLMSFII